MNDAVGGGLTAFGSANMPRVRQSLPSLAGPLTTVSVLASGAPLFQATACRLPVEPAA